MRLLLLDVKCASLPRYIKHEVHEHPLLLKEECVSEGCAACYQHIKIFSFGCDACNFNLHYYCALLPRTIRHRYDKHPFAITHSPIPDGPNQYICEFCEEDMHNPDKNIQLGCYYIAYLGTMYDGDLKCALAAYNAGSGTVDQWLSDKKYSKDGISLSKIPYRETEQYVNKVLNYRKIYRILYRVREGRKV